MVEGRAKFFAIAGGGRKCYIGVGHQGGQRRDIEGTTPLLWSYRAQRLNRRTRERGGRPKSDCFRLPGSSEVVGVRFLPSSSVDGDFTKRYSLGICRLQKRIDIPHTLAMVPRKKSNSPSDPAISRLPGGG